MCLRKSFGIGFSGLRNRQRFRKRCDVIGYFIRTRKHKPYLEIGAATGRCLEGVRCAAGGTGGTSAGTGLS